MKKLKFKVGKEYKVLLKDRTAIQGVYKGMKKKLLIFQSPYFQEEKFLISPSKIEGFYEVGIFPSCIDWEKVNEILFNDEEFKEV